MQYSRFVLPVLIAAVILAVTAPSNAQSERESDPGMRAVNVKFFGGFTGFDVNGYKVFRSTLGQMFIEGTITKIVTLSQGKEGGASLCVELDHSNKEISVKNILGLLSSIKPSEISIYNYEIVSQCN